MLHHNWNMELTSIVGKQKYTNLVGEMFADVQI